MYNELSFDEPGQSKDLAFLGGCPYLSLETPWPTDSKGKPLLHLASMPAAFFRRHAPQTDVAESFCISVFTPYDLLDDSYIDIAMSTGGHAIAHIPDERAPPPAAPPFEPRLFRVTINPAEDSEENGIAKVLGIPAWLQEEQAQELQYTLQINSFRLNRAAPTHRGILVGGMGYLLLDRNIQSASTNCGRFVIQTT